MYIQCLYIQVRERNGRGKYLTHALFDNYINLQHPKIHMHYRSRLVYRINDKKHDLYFVCAHLNEVAIFGMKTKQQQKVVWFMFNSTCMMLIYWQTIVCKALFPEKMLALVCQAGNILRKIKLRILFLSWSISSWHEWDKINLNVQQPPQMNMENVNLEKNTNDFI